ncbi:MAG: restriction endonuclease subunit S [Deltaproteobacteria bacterium]|nr:restriction endonuclease subunit S [Deltaproteobacteria bacterium]
MTQKWQQVKLGDACTVVKGITYKTEDYASESDGQIFLTLKCIAKGGGFNFNGIKYYRGKTEDDQLVQPGDLIIANTDLTRAGDVIGAPLVVPKIRSGERYVISMDISKLITDGSVLDKDYLYHFLTSSNARNYMQSISNGSTVLHLKVKLVDLLKIPMPELSVQKKVAEMLNAIETQIHKSDQIITKTELLKKGLLNELIGQYLKSDKNTKWKISKLAEVCTLITDGKHGDCQNEQDSGYYFISSKDIHNGIIDYSDSRQITRLDFEEADKRTQLELGDLVMTNSGTIGRMAIAHDSEKTRKTTFQKSVAIIKPKKSIVSAEYLYYYFLCILPSLQITSNGSAQKNLLLKDMRSLQIPVPDNQEQKRIVAILSEIDRKIGNENMTLEKSRNLKNGLMDDIFSMKVEVN